MNGGRRHPSGHPPAGHRLPGLPRLLLVALVVALSTLVAPATTSTVRAATAPDLTIVTVANYAVRPAQQKVRVTVDATVTNTLADTATNRYYFDSAYLAVLPGTENFAVTSAGAKPTVSVRSTNRSYTLLSIGLGRRLYGGHHTVVRLTFDLPDPGGAPTRDVRIGDSLVSFPVWAFASNETPGSSVAVTFPPGYTIQLTAGNMEAPTTNASGQVTYRSGVLTDPLTFYAFFIGDRPGAFAETPLIATSAGQSIPLIVRAWTEDPAWGTKVGSIVRLGLPALASAIGLDYRGQGLVVEEAVSRTLGGYAGLFDPQAATIEIAYYADPFVALHETAHAWFNGSLVADRWIGEAFASYYAARAAVALDITVTPPKLTRDLVTLKIPLNAWPRVGRADPAVEDYAYAASYELANKIAKRATPAGLAAVWRAAAASEAAYQPYHAGTPRVVAPGPPDWRGLLDLLEERTTADYTDLWATWVVRPQDEPLLAARSQARTAYAAAVVAAGAWELPSAIRAAMNAWQFSQATELIDEAQAAILKRDEVEQRAAAAGLALSPAMQAAFEGPSGPAAATAVAAAEIEAIGDINAAQTAAGRTGGPLEQLGLLGATPDRQLADARQEFATGDLATARDLAAAAEQTWLTAGDRGRQRVVAIAAILLGLLVLAISLTAAARIWRARRRAGVAETA